MDICHGTHDRHQGVYANIVTNQNDASFVRIYIGSAAGPYKKPLKDCRYDRGIHQRIRTHNQPSLQTRSQKKHESLLREPGIRSNWLIMVSFQQNVPCALVHIAHAVMAVMFGSYESIPYISCRPSQLRDYPRSWGLNELSPLSQHGLANYNRTRHGKMDEEMAFIHKTNVLAGERCQDSRRQRHNERLQSGGNIHVNVLVINSVVKRFFITPMTKNDGSHIDISIPRVAGLTFGLEISRSVNLRCDLEPGATHQHPYAIQAPNTSLACTLGILISGHYACGPQLGNKFDYWIQCNRPEAIGKAENIVRKLYSISGMETTLKNDMRYESQEAIRFQGWISNSPQKIATSPCDLPSQFPKQLGFAPGPTPQNNALDHHPAYTLCLGILQQLSYKVKKKKVRATEVIQEYFKAESTESIARTIAEAIQPGVVSILESTDPLVPPRLLSLKGNLEDKCQGVYADVVTSPDPLYFRIYIGSAAGARKSRKDSGLSRRIKEHLASIKMESRPESGMLHSNELRKASTKPNFIILVRFAEEVECAVVRIAEALMTILFCAWNSQSFHSFRPKGLTPIPRHIGLNNANPLTGGFFVLSDFSHPNDFRKREEYLRNCKMRGQRKAAKNLARSLENAKEGGVVPVHCRSSSRNGPYGYEFKVLTQRIFIPSHLGRDLGLDITEKVNVVYDVSVGRPHHTPYALRAKFSDPSRRLGITLKGVYGRGPLKGLGFEKWLQCGSVRAISTASSIIELVQEPASGMRGLA